MLVVLAGGGLSGFLAAIPAYRALAWAYPRHRRVLLCDAALLPLVPYVGAFEDAVAIASSGGAPERLRGAAIAVNLLSGRSRIECGCGGPGEGQSWTLAARNVVLAGIALVAAQAPLPATVFGPFEWLTAAAAIASLWLVLASVEKLAGNMSWLAAADAARDQHPARH